jgi:hypothetical protein
LIQVEKQLRLSLKKARAATRHPGEKGTKVEVAVRDVLRQFLPADLKVGHGMVFDSYGGISRQADVVIANADHPFTYRSEESGEYMIEGVSAVGDVKSTLTMHEPTDSIDKGKALQGPPSHRAIYRPWTNLSEYMPQRNVMPPFFVLAFDSYVKFPRILERLEASEPAPSPSTIAESANYSTPRPQSPIDAVCILGKGVLWNLKAGDGRIPIRRSYGTRAQGWVGFKTRAPLAFTLGWLHMSMPRIERSHSIFAYYMDRRERSGDLMSSESGFEMAETEMLDINGRWTSAPPTS